MLPLINIVLVSTFAGILYTTYVVIWRLYWSPLAQFPGPKFAAATFLYEFYYDIFQGGQFVFKKLELHKKYGPIVRINPWELHVNDPDFYDELYAGGSRRRDKFAYHARQFGSGDSAFGTVSHELHRIRRAPLNKFFSKASIIRLEPLIQSVVNRLCDRLHQYQKAGKAAEISSAYACLSNDVITNYAFAQSHDFVGRSTDFRTDVHEALSHSGAAIRISKQIPWMTPMFQIIPRSIMRLFSRPMAGLLDYNDELASQIQPILNGTPTKIKPACSNHLTIFHEIMNSDLPPSEVKLDRLKQEAFSVLGAGTETTAWTLSVTTYYILANPAIHNRMKEELRPVFQKAGGRPSWTQLEQLPYLQGVISEGLRLSFGVSAHLPRVAPDEVLCYQNWKIPAGTPIGMTSVLLHLDPAIFPSPQTFRPSRWLENPRLSRYLVSFSKGSRKCLGMNLAYAELYLCLCYIIMEFPDMKLFDTTVADVQIIADDFIPRSSGRGVRVLMD